jgi:hypothetical protein
MLGKQQSIDAKNKEYGNKKIMNKKNIILFGGAVLAVLIVVTLIGMLVFRNNQPEEPSNVSPDNQIPTNNTTLPTTTGIEQTKDTIIIQTPTGGVETKNFYKTALRVDEREALLIEQADEYVITYFRQAGRFKIIITTPFKDEALKAREKAEQEFLTILAIGKNDACKLNPMIIFLKNEDEYLVDNIFSLSFCQ